MTGSRYNSKKDEERPQSEDEYKRVTKELKSKE